MSDDSMKGLISTLEADFAAEERANKQFRIIGGVLMIFVAGYLAFAYSQIRALTDPEGLADAATGYAITAVPEASDALRVAVVDGAPDLAHYLSSSAVNMVPAYRGVLEGELYPVIDEVCSILAGVAVSKMAELSKDGTLALGEEQLALQAAANGVVERLDRVLTQGLDEPMEDYGPTPRQMIERSLRSLHMVDSGLKRVAQGKGSRQERALIMGWLNLLAQYEEDAERSARDNYRTHGAPD